MSLEILKKCIETIEKLRDPQKGCPWDLEQTHESLLPYLIEESYEFIEATKASDDQRMKDELGDLLLQVLLHSTFAKQRGAFTLDDVASNLTEKIIRRHPHVFNSPNPQISKEEVMKNWAKIKEKEAPRIKSPIPDKLLLNPALEASSKIGTASKKVNFDWETVDQVMYKVEEEWQELKEELYQKRTYRIEQVEEELGDLLFSVAQLARHLKLSPEETLHKANKKFIRRFRLMEKKAQEKNQSMENLTPEQMEKLWVEAKEELKK
jgi:MazG family protein